MTSLPAAHPAIPPARTGVLLLNLGTPDGTDYRSVRRYLAEFLSDRRVIEAPRWFWLPLLHGIILTTRPRRSGHAYKKIWNEANNESPLKTHMRTLAEQVAHAFNTPQAPTGHPPLIEWAMRYGNPSIPAAIERMQAQGCRRIIALALYPQYSATTTASAYDAVFDALKTMRWQPALTTLGPYHDHPLYIEALAKSLRHHLSSPDLSPTSTPDISLETPRAFPRSEGGERSEGRRDAPLVSAANQNLHIISSFHGLPKRYFEQGDPYHCHCQKTSRLLREAMGWPEDRWHTAFQSRFGPTEWLRPYLTDTVSRLASEGVKRIAVISPGFAVDCIETLEELNIALREQFLGEGGESFTYIPCLNAGAAQVELVKHMVTAAL